MFPPANNRGSEPTNRIKRCSYRCASGNRWSVSLDIGDRKLRRRCLRCQQFCYPATTTYTVPSTRGLDAI